jgi:hypothetical protein
VHLAQQLAIMEVFLDIVPIHITAFAHIMIHAPSATYVRDLFLKIIVKI